VRSGLQSELEQPIAGWMGASDPFEMGDTYLPATGIRRFLSGTPSIVGMQPMRDMLDLIEGVGIDAIREKSVLLTEFVVEVFDQELSGAGMTLGTTREPSRRGGHVTLEHPDAKVILGLAWARDVLPDFRAPHGIRVGLSPLSTSFAEVADGLTVLRECVDG
jgi:kynureninase